MEQGVKIYTAHNLHHIRTSEVNLTCVYTNHVTSIACETVVLVTMRLPVDDLCHSNLSTMRIGDAYGPSRIAMAVYSGHQYARDLGRRRGEPNRFRRELVEIARQTGSID